MACKFCRESLFREKLGRCKRCMWLNLGLLIFSGGGWYLLQQSGPRQVETIALLLTFSGALLLMLLHIGAYIYYRLQGITHPTEDIHSRE
ncbi:DUF3624 domain-containing protein [Psychromonas aquimarina]|uniref:DUF3624 domain-containing protein n=1 Tax=Psychromonas aquimarina TaxID=444919 RepID=UPI00040DD592|nr:DUF3624 domain-containing protein [Psychromonas aquimarina]